MRSASDRTTLIVVLPLALILFSFANSPISAQEQFENPGPVEIGGACSERDDFYHSVTTTRTSWKVRELYAVPTGTTDPLTWEDYSSFQTQLLQVLDPSEDAAAFAQACGITWQNFFSGNADVLISLERNVTGTDDILECQSGVWNFTSTQNIDQTDIYEWLHVGTFDVTGDASTSILQQQIQALLDELNSQPGAQNIE